MTSRDLSPDRWSEAAAWTGDGLRREVFFFRVGDVDLYGSLYAAAELTRSYGVVACHSWGVEADRTDPLARGVALGMARLGGAGLVFHYPGHGDSFGELAGLAMTDLVDAAVGAAAEADRRCPGVDWIYAGFMLGASVATIAQARAGVDELLLVQPALRPGAYFRRMTTRTEPIAPGPSPRAMMEVGDAAGMAYGYPIPRRILERADGEDAATLSALAAFRGGGAVVRHEKPQDEDLAPEGFERIEVPGAWRFGSFTHPDLAKAATRWLDRRTAGAAPGAPDPP